jgi:hypothetical protein
MLLRAGWRGRPRRVLPSSRILPPLILGRTPWLVRWRWRWWTNWALRGQAPWLGLPDPSPTFLHLLLLKHYNECLLLPSSSPNFPREAKTHRRFSRQSDIATGKQFIAKKLRASTKSRWIQKRSATPVESVEGESGLGLHRGNRESIAQSWPKNSTTISSS